MASIDPNTWYFISEGRVAKVNEKLSNNLQNTPDGLRVFGLTGQVWQFQPIGDVAGRYAMRTNTSGVGQQLSACFDREEGDPSKTVACLARSSGDDGQKWDISPWGDGSLKIQNVANGTGYVLDVHQGSNLFMSGQIESPDVSVRFPAQHWILSSDKPVNDGGYSTVFTNGPSTAPTATTTSGATRPTSAPSGTNPGSAPGPSQTTEPSTGLSPGAAAGVGVGVSLGVIAVVGCFAFLWWRHRKAAKAAKAAPTDPSAGGIGGASPMQQSIPPYSPQTQDAKYGQLGRYDQQPPVEAYAPPVVHEVPGQEQHFELDSNQVATRPGDGAQQRV